MQGKIPFSTWVMTKRHSIVHIESAGRLTIQMQFKPHDVMVRPKLLPFRVTNNIIQLTKQNAPRKGGD